MTHHSLPAGECLKASFAPLLGNASRHHSPPLLGNASRHHSPPPAGECLKASFAPPCWGMPQGIIRPPPAGECLKASFAPPPAGECLKASFAPRWGMPQGIISPYWVKSFLCMLSSFPGRSVIWSCFISDLYVWYHIYLPFA